MPGRGHSSGFDGTLWLDGDLPRGVVEPSPIPHVRRTGSTYRIRACSIKSGIGDHAGESRGDGHRSSATCFRLGFLMLMRCFFHRDKSQLQQLLDPAFFADENNVRGAHTVGAGTVRTAGDVSRTNLRMPSPAMLQHQRAGGAVVGTLQTAYRRSFHVSDPRPASTPRVSMAKWAAHRYLI